MDWKYFLASASNYLRSTWNGEPIFWSWCSWTTFTRLGLDSGYWTGPLPLEDELSDEGVRDGGAWRQPFYYKDLAHVIIPRKFIFNKDLSDPLKEFEMVQDIFGLSEYLKKHNLAHNLHDWALDVKVF